MGTAEYLGNKRRYRPMHRVKYIGSSKPGVGKEICTRSTRFYSLRSAIALNASWKENKGSTFVRLIRTLQLLRDLQRRG